MSLIKKFLTVSGLTVVSRVFGVAREAIFSHFLGTCSEMDAFLIAFKFPRFFRTCFAEGGFHSMFVPYFTDFTARGKYNGAKIFSSRIFTILFWWMCAFSVIIFIFADTFVAITAPGFKSSPETFQLAVDFTRIIFPNVGFCALSTVYSGVLVAHKRFLPFALSPILVNIVLICSLFVGGDDFLSSGYRVSYGVLLSGILQFVFLYFYVKTLRLQVPSISKVKVSKKMREFFKKLTPVVVGAGAAQINVFADSIFCSFLPTGSISYIYFADRFIQFPLALFGISVATILLPEIASIISKGSKTDRNAMQNNAMIFTLRMAIPSVVGLIVMANLLIGALYGHGRFTETSVDRTAIVLQIFAIGLPAYVISKIFASILFAQKDSKTPVRAAVISIICNIIFNYMLVRPFGIYGIAAGTTVAGFVNAYIMYRKSKDWFKLDKEMITDISRILLASIVMGIVVWGVICMMNCGVSKLNALCKTIFIGVNMIIGAGVYSSILYLMGDKSMINIIQKIRRRKH